MSLDIIAICFCVFLVALLIFAFYYEYRNAKKEQLEAKRRILAIMQEHRKQDEAILRGEWPSSLTHLLEIKSNKEKS